MLLYSNILPLGTEEGQSTITDCFKEQLSKADRVDISVGYTSNASLSELAALIADSDISKICLIIGMYYIEGMPESAYHTAIRINKEWMETEIGEIRLVKTFKYHGKLYCFYKDGKPFAAIIGSANLGALKLEASNRRQYEIASLITKDDELSDIAKHIDALKQSSCSANISEISGMTLIRERNTALNGIELVTSVPQSNVDFYKRCESKISFYLQLKVPSAEER